MKRFGRDYEKLNNLIPNKSDKQIKRKLYLHSGADKECETLFPDFKSRKLRKWTYFETKAFWRVVEKFGVHYEKL